MASQIKFFAAGLWHRRQEGNGGDHTACGRQIPNAYLSRDPLLDEHLCPECFSSRERDTGQLRRIEREALERAKADGFSDDEEPTDEIDPAPVTTPFQRSGEDDNDDSG